jgi:hypothetical protein
VTVACLQADRDRALRSDIPGAAKILKYVAEGTNTKQHPGSALDQKCSAQRSNVVANIIDCLRTKTAEDLGDRPEPWILKYAPKD